MDALLRLLQPLLIIILLVSVCALTFVAYTQHEGQQRWKDKYENAIRIQQYFENKYDEIIEQNEQVWQTLPDWQR